MTTPFRFALISILLFFPLASGQTTLVWDDGTTHTGTSMQGGSAPAGGDFFYRIVTQASAVGGWRTVLRVTSGEADVSIRRGANPTDTQFTKNSDRVGDDGFVMHANEFSPGQEWFIRVKASGGAAWELVSGEPFVQNLGTLAAGGASSSGVVPVGPEGMRFFRTNVPANTQAWRLWLNGGTQEIQVRKDQIPHPDLVWGERQAAQMLLVPPYLGDVPEVHFLTVVDTPGSNIDLDSRLQTVTNLNFGSSTTINSTGYGYHSFRVDIPIDEIAWEVEATTNSGATAAVAVRRVDVPNEHHNEAFSEVAGATTNSLTLSPPTLTNGAYYVTVYADGVSNFTLKTGPPNITIMNFVDSVPNPSPGKAGWVFFQVPDVTPQVTSLGWQVALANQVPGTEIAIRRNAVPSRWNRRSNGSTSSVAGHVDFSDLDGCLQRPGHQADVWYIGIYQPDAPLGNFTLNTTELTAAPVPFDGGSITTTAQQSDKWEFYRVDVPVGALGWDLRLLNVTSGMPEIAVRKATFPQTLTSDSWGRRESAVSWAVGRSWHVTDDWTGWYNSSAGVDQRGRVLTLSMGRPLEPGTYYVGVKDKNGPAPMSYTLESRGIGTGLQIPVAPLNFNGGSTTISGLAPREARYFKVTVPAGQPSWKLELDQTSGEAMMVVLKDVIPNSRSGYSWVNGGPGKEMQHLGNREHFLMMPDFGKNQVNPGDYYVAVIGEGTVPAGDNIGAGTSDVVLRSVGNLPVTILGAVGATDLTLADTLERTELKGYEFTVPAGTLGVEVSLEGVSGNPFISLAPGALPRPDSQAPLDFGFVGGRNEGSQNDEDVVTVQNPTPGIYRVLVRALNVAANPAPAGFTLRVRALMPPVLAFDGGSQTVSGQVAGTWRFFRVDVPAGALGWDIRALHNGGLSPNLHIARGVLPLAGGAQFGVRSGKLTWPVGQRVSPFADWMGGSNAPDGRRLQQTLLVTGIGRPLEPGTYYVGVTHPDTSLAGTLNYTIQSRAIGAMGSGASLEVTNLPFSGGSASINNLAPHEAAYYKVTIPAATRSWKLKLDVTSDELLMAVRKDSVPGTRLVDPAGQSNEVDSLENFGGDGIRIRKTGNEHFTVLPDPGVDFLDPGDYYIAVISEGDSVNSGTLGMNAASGVLTSIGSSPVHAFGTLGTVALQTADTLENGENKMYSFEVTPGTEGVQIILENPTGKPQMAVVPGDRLPQPPTEGSFGSHSYGFENGETAGRAVDDEVVTLASPTPGIWHIVVRARDLWPNTPDATYNLKIVPQGSAALAFDGGTVSVSNQATATWQYFEVTVPPGANGWDVRLDNVTSGDPELVVRRASRPTVKNSNFSNFGSTTTWPVDGQHNPQTDYSEMRYLAGGTENIWGRTLTVGMGRPLEPGTYYVGVTDGGGGDPMSYVIRSRGIGVGMALPVQPLAFNGGSATITALPAREPTFFKVTVPAGVRTWKMRLGMSFGDASLYVLRDTVPNMIANSSSTNGLGINGGLQVQKEGNEHFLLLPPSDSPFVVPGDYYIAVNSEGVNPTGFGWPFGWSYGTGSTDAVIESFGEITPTIMAPSGPPTSTALEGGEFASYQFDVAPNTDWVQLRLDNVVGDPVLSVALDDPPIPHIRHSSNYYGFARGHRDDQDSHPRIITLLAPTPGTYTTLVQALASQGGADVPASYDLTVSANNFLPLNFDAALNGNGGTHQSTHTLIDDEKLFFRVVVPAQVNGQNVIGWKIDTDHVQGDTTLHVFRDPAIPNPRTRILPDTGIISTPYLKPGIWYVEAEAQGLTEFTLTSSAVRPERTWTMPRGNPAGGPIFGDSGIDPSGNPLPGDGGIDLAEDDWHFYAVNVPTGNGGLLRTVLENISGNPNLFVQSGHVPTSFHGSNVNGNAGSHYRSSLTGTGTEFGNWVPIAGNIETELTPGLWYLGVRADGGSNARYRLKVGTAVISYLDLNTGSTTNVEVANKDIRYFEVYIPKPAPASWEITFSESVGAVKFWVRDHVPPGNTVRNTSYVSATSDRRNQGPYLLASGVTTPGTHSIPVPSLRPGHTYYLGFQAETVDSVFSVSSSTSGPTINAPFVPFSGGNITTTLGPGAVEYYRVLAPPGWTRWKHTSTHATGIDIRLEQGTLPLPAQGFSHYRNSLFAANTSLNQPLTGVWPWLSGYDYYFRIENTTANTEAIVIDLDGKNTHTEDEDNDGLPDAWERMNFGNLTTGRSGIDGPDNDGVDLLLEYAFGMDPNRSDLQHLPTAGSTNQGGASYLTITYRRRIGGTIRPDGSYRWNKLRYQVLASSDMATWNSGPAFTLEVSATPDLNGTTETVIERCLAPIGSGCDFLRVRVESN